MDSVSKDSKEYESLKLYAKSRALLLKVYPTFRNFPRIEHRQLCNTIKNSFEVLLNQIAIAKHVTAVRTRMDACKKAAASLQDLTTWYYVSVEMRYISRGHYEEVDQRLTELKKILAGFMKSIGSSRRKP
ncbi:four helix bundle protein [Marinobacter adhaerens]|uniref:Four helix bundle protein n=1 Tax=Marinobacter adhaerens TaxID=1033846 RepID=A0A851HTG0_9GAMM|nr:four helix bundle protein [Marinobacter adhaerens]NWN92307.1 four helix bundle protein [Marinobacter adhaerens]